MVTENILKPLERIKASVATAESRPLQRQRLQRRRITPSLDYTARLLGRITAHSYGTYLLGRITASECVIQPGD